MMVIPWSSYFLVKLCWKLEYLVTDIGGGADISMESAFWFRAAAVVDMSVNRRRTTRGYDWRFMYLILKKAGLSQA